jgi:hypothetical protein
MAIGVWPVFSNAWIGASHPRVDVLPGAWAPFLAEGSGSIIRVWRTRRLAGDRLDPGCQVHDASLEIAYPPGLRLFPLPRRRRCLRRTSFVQAMAAIHAGQLYLVRGLLPGKRHLDKKWKGASVGMPHALMDGHFRLRPDVPPTEEFQSLGTGAGNPTWFDRPFTCSLERKDQEGWKIRRPRQSLSKTSLPLALHSSRSGNTATLCAGACCAGS